MAGRFPTFALAAGVLLVSAVALEADAQGPAPRGSLLHEFVAPEADEDLSLAATTLDGELPAAIHTPSGIATAPDPQKPPSNDSVYGDAAAESGPSTTLEPDRDTRQPDVESYDDPFSPSTSPFKRLRAFDSVEEDYTLRVADDRRLTTVPIGGAIAEGDEPFFADFTVELIPNRPVRIPSVGPDARPLKMHTEPDVAAVILRDPADNWFLQAQERKRVRVVMEIAIQRSTFGSTFSDEATWERLSLKIPPQPEKHREPARRVMEAVGVSRNMRPSDAAAKMIDYFRGFASSDNPPHEHGDIYLDLALSKKGVCRHRAFAFLVTALQLGLPTRMVTNEAHAWVEIYDGKLWHRVDLGGAAMNLDEPPDMSKPQHKPPEDPYAWPESTEKSSGQELSSRMRDDATSGQTGGQPDPSSTNPQSQNGSSATTNDPTNANGPQVPTPATTAGPGPNDPKATKLELEHAERVVRRGSVLKVRGKAEAAGVCKSLRVDVLLSNTDHPSIRLGSLSTDDNGIFDGSVTVPRDIAAADYDIVIETPGDSRCAGARIK